MPRDSHQRPHDAHVTMLATTGASYLNGHDPRDPHASPLYGDLSGLPPVQLHVGTNEVLLDDARRGGGARGGGDGGRRSCSISPDDRYIAPSPQHQE